jgi:hypothetical protein
MGTRWPKDEDEVTSALHTVEHLIGSKLTMGSIRTPASEAVRKNPAAAAFGQLGASKGGKARAAKLSERKRKEIAKKGAAARWGKNRGGH